MINGGARPPSPPGGPVRARNSPPLVANMRGLPWSLKGTGAPETALVPPLKRARGTPDAGRATAKMGAGFASGRANSQSGAWPGRRTAHTSAGHARASAASCAIKTSARVISEPFRFLAESEPRLHDVDLGPTRWLRANGQSIPGSSLRTCFARNAVSAATFGALHSLVVTTDHSDPAASDPAREREKGGGAPHLGCLCAAGRDESV